MNIRLILLIAGYGALLTINNSCKQEAAYIPVDTELKKYFNYQEGSHWIYKDSVTGQEDSFAARGNVAYITTRSNSDAKEEILGYGIGNYRDSIPPPYRLGLSISLVGKRVNVESITDSSQGLTTEHQITINYRPSFTYPFQTGQLPNYGYSDGYAFVTDILSIFSLNGQEFQDVAVVHQYLQNGTSKDHDDWFWINKDVGIIKMKITRTNGMDNTWELVRYNLIKK